MSRIGKRNLQIENTPFPIVPQSTFNLSQSRKTTFNAGKLLPVLMQEILPGDEFTLNTTALIRSSALIAPSMDNAEVHINYFFVPNRIIWENFKEFMGENKTGTWYKKGQQLSIPQITSPSEGFAVGSLADHLGLPVNQDIGSITHLPFRAFAEVYNEWYRDQNLQNPLQNKKDNTLTEAKTWQELVATNQQLAMAINGAALPNVNKYKDYFTSALPTPQKGEDVVLSLLSLDNLDIITKDGEQFKINDFAFQDQDGDFPIENYPTDRYDAVSVLDMVGPEYIGRQIDHPTDVIYNGKPIPANWKAGRGIMYHPLYKDKNTNRFSSNANFGNDNKPERMLTGITADSVSGLTLEADTSQSSLTINQLRKLLAQQKYLETDAIGGSRYVEKIFTHFGVMTDDARVNRPEILGLTKFDIDVSQVAQTSETTDNSPQGNVSAFSLTQKHSQGFTKSFTEHGILLGVLSVKTQQTYQYGINKFWKNKDVLDVYTPEFAHLGEQPVYNYEIYADNTEHDNEVFGYQSAFAYLKFPVNSLAGDFNSRSTKSLDIWHYAEARDECPTLSEDFIRQSDKEVNRTLAVQSDVSDQFIADIYFDIKAKRKLPLYSVPQLRG